MSWIDLKESILFLFFGWLSLCSFFIAFKLILSGKIIPEEPKEASLAIDLRTNEWIGNK